MAEGMELEQPTSSRPATTGKHRHTRLFLIAFYALAFVWGARSIFFWEPSRMDFIFPVALAVILGWWAVVDARLRDHPIPLLARPWFFLAASLLVPGYVVWSRRWRGVGWLMLHAFLWFALATVVMNIGVLMVFGIP